MLRGVTWAAATLLVAMSLTSDPVSGDLYATATVTERPGPRPSVHSSDGVSGMRLADVQHARLGATPAPPAPPSP